MSTTQRGTERAPFTEGSTLLLTADLVDETGAAVPAAAVSDVRVTLTTLTGGAVINGRTNQAAKSTNGGTTVDGTYTLRLNGADCASQAGEASGTTVQRRVTLTVTYSTSGGTGTLNVVHDYYVALFATLPQ